MRPRALQAALRALGLVALAVLAGGLGALGWRMAAPARPAAAIAGACTDIAIGSNGWHTNLLIPATLLTPSHPIRRLFPDARRFAIGWGDRDAYRFGSEKPWLHLLAVTPPGRSVVSVAPDPEQSGRRVGVGAAGARALGAYLERALRIGPDGRVVIVDTRRGGPGFFLEGTEPFGLFSVCNHWTARALKAAGLPVSDFGAWTGAAVTRQLALSPPCP